MSSSELLANPGIALALIALMLVSLLALMLFDRRAFKKHHLDAKSFRELYPDWLSWISNGMLMPTFVVLAATKSWWVLAALGCQFFTFTCLSTNLLEKTDLPKAIIRQLSFSARARFFLILVFLTYQVWLD